MAEGYARDLGSDFLEINSAGTEPKGINPLTVKVMQEDGVDISLQRSKELTTEMLDHANLVITLCSSADEKCPLLPKGIMKRHWSLEDPAKTMGNKQQILAQFRLVRDKIKTLVENLVTELRAQNYS